MTESVGIISAGGVALPRSGVVVVSPEACLACRECEVACSLYHEQECNPALSSVQVDFDDFRPGFPDVRVCKQCDFAACYYACTTRNREPALSLDLATGAPIIDQSKCTGCGACAKACPMAPERAVIFSRRGATGKKVYFKCDLCRDRERGPICVEICPGKALTYTPTRERRR